MATRSGVKLDDIVDYSDQVAAIVLAIRGDFDREISEIKAARAAMADDIAALGSPQEIAENRAAADQYLAEAKAKADQLTQSVTDLLANANAKIADIAEREKALATREQAVSDRAANLSQSEARLVSDTAARDAKLDERSNKLDKFAGSVAAMNIDVEQKIQSLGDAQAQLAADRAAFNKHLDALKVPTE